MTIRYVPRSGVFAALGVLSFIVATLGALLVTTTPDNWFGLWQDPYLLHVTFFSFYQALGSTVLSVLPALPVALALYRRRFAGRQWLIKLASVTLVLPVLVGVFGIVAIYGNSGVVMTLVHGIYPDCRFSVYGLNGILLAHVFFNLPYASRLLLQSLESIPQEQNNLAYHLGMNAWQRFTLVEWPRLRQTLPSIVGLVFMLCFTSFATVMALGGGPKSTTIELAIYQAIKFNFDLGTGAVLALWQMLLCGSLVFLLQRRTHSPEVESGSIPASSLQLRAGRWLTIWDGFWLMVLAGVLLPPLLMIVIRGVNHNVFKVLSAQALWQAAGHSFFIALFASVLALIIGVCILSTSRVWRRLNRRQWANGLEMTGNMILVTPSLVISTGVFLLLRQWTDVFDYAVWIVIGVNALMALPYVLKILHQPMWLLEKQYYLLCDSLGIKGWKRLWVVEGRAMLKPLFYALVMGFLLSMGDLTAIALFGSQDMRTLPLYLLQLMGSYQMDSAAVVALLLMIISVGVLSVAEWILHQLRKKTSDRETASC